MAQSHRNSITDTKSTNVVLEKESFRVHAETLSRLESRAQTPEPEAYPVDLLLKLFTLVRVFLFLFSISVIGFDITVITHVHNGGAWELPWIFVVRPSAPSRLHSSLTNVAAVPALRVLEHGRHGPPPPPSRHARGPGPARRARGDRLDRRLLPVPVRGHDGARPRDAAGRKRRRRDAREGEPGLVDAACPHCRVLGHGARELAPGDFAVRLPGVLSDAEEGEEEA